MAQAITKAVEIPTIGIGAGPYTTGQVLVYHDALGMMSHPHHEHFVPKFCKKYARVGDAVTRGLEEYKSDVESGKFPGDEYSPYKVKEDCCDLAMSQIIINERYLTHNCVLLELFALVLVRCRRRRKSFLPSC